MKLWFVGDLHGKADCVLSIMDKARELKPDAIIQVGDFGIRWGGKSCSIHKIFTRRFSKPDFVPWYTCGGNHDNWNKWNDLSYDSLDEKVELAPGCFFIKRGHIINISNKKILFLGGAISTDAHHRKINENYWNTEVPSGSEFLTFKKNIPEAEIIVTHEAPTRVKLYDEPRTDWFSSLLENIIPNKNTLWFYGHHHQLRYDYVNDVHYFGTGLHGEFLELDDDKVNFYFEERKTRVSDFNKSYKMNSLIKDVNIKE